MGAMSLSSVRYSVSHCWIVKLFPGSFGSFCTVTQRRLVMPLFCTRSSSTFAEFLHVERDVAEAAALPGDVDRRPRRLRELNGADKRRHPIGEGELRAIEKDAGELWVERDHLLLHVAHVRRRHP